MPVSSLRAWSLAARCPTSSCTPNDFCPVSSSCVQEQPIAVCYTILAFHSCCRDALVGHPDEEDRPRGIAYTVSVPYQHNVILVVSRAVRPGRASGLRHYETVERLRASGAAVGATAGFSFDAEPLVARDYMPLVR